MKVKVSFYLNIDPITIIYLGDLLFDDDLLQQNNEKNRKYEKR